MNKVKIILYIYIIFFFEINKCNTSKQKSKIIISLTSDHKNIHNTKKIINSIIEQHVNREYYQIVLILSSKEYQNIYQLPKEFILLKKFKIIQILIVNEHLSGLKRTLVTMKKFIYNPILIINNICKLPYGWLEMFIRDHIKYPNDAIAASIQYFFDKDIKIKEFTEGFKGYKFGTFNHVTELIFNFVIINIDLGGILFPEKFFTNINFYNYSLYINSTFDSEDFWESAFIIMEDKILRQSSKIFDYTKYLLNNFNDKKYYREKIYLLTQSKLSFLSKFPNFGDIIKKRHHKIIVSIASYPERFFYLKDLMTFIRNQSFPINQIYFFFYEGHKTYYNINITDVKIIYTKLNLKPHLKYFYAMKLFRDYAIITLDDDLGYSYDTFESLINSYIENPNIISGRRAHLMTYKKNGELRGYFNWIYECRLINESNLNITLTNGAGTIFPPDILNIKDEYLSIINETITCDDLTLKYFSVQKGIPQKWVFNKHLMGVRRKLKKSNSSPLFRINRINNNKCINKLNMNNNKIILNNLCVPYKNIATGLSIYLYDIHQIKKKFNNLYFEINAYSYCPIDPTLTFKIYFGNLSAYCFFNETKFLILNKKKISVDNIRIASCHISKLYKDVDIDCYNFPKAISKKNLLIKICNYKKYSTVIFIDFICKANNICVLKVLLYDDWNIKEFPFKMNNKKYLCSLYKKSTIYNNIFAVIKIFKCKFLNSFYNIHFNKKIFISGLPRNEGKKGVSIKDNIILNQFIISRTVLEKDGKFEKLIIIGKLVDDLAQDLYYLNLYLLYPKVILKCSLKPYSKYIQSKIYCKINDIINITTNSEFLIENQFIYLYKYKLGLVIINEESILKINFIKDFNFKVLQTINSIELIGKDKFHLYSIFIYIILLIIKMKIKFK